MTESFCHHVTPVEDPRDRPYGRAVAAHIVAAGGRLTCCGQPMADAGECSLGCCDYFRCGVCGRLQVCEYGD